MKWTGLAIVACLMLLAGCSAGTPRNLDWSAPTGSLVWPEPPASPRIRWIRDVEPLRLGKEKSAGKFLHWLTGDKTDVLPMLSPYALVADGQGRVWVADPEAAVVHCLDLVRQQVDYWFTVGGVNLVAPIGLAIDPVRRQLYIADSGLRKVFIVNPDGKSLGQLEMPGGFQRPTGLAVDRSGLVYVADALSGHVEVFTPSGGHVKTIVNPDGKTGEFDLPIALAVDHGGDLLVNDSITFRMELLDPKGGSLASFGGVGDVPGTFARPRGVAFDSDGHAYVVDAAFGNVQIFTREGKLLLYFGKWGDGPGEFSLPAGIFIDQFDRIYLADSYNHRIQIFQYLKPEGS